MEYIDYIRWRIQLLKHKNITLFPIEKIVNNREKGNEILKNTSKE
jgi:hypothetical protein